MANIGEQKKIYEIPEPVSVPDTVPTEEPSRKREPFVGYKTLQIVVNDDGTLALEGSMEAPYGIDATATCGIGYPHTAPDWDCSCGFYALAERPKSPDYGQFIAQVELFGTVMEGKRGWRASRQRVLSIQTVSRTCSFGCDEPAVGFTNDGQGGACQVCAKHAALGYATPAQMTALLGTEVSWGD